MVKRWGVVLAAMGLCMATLAPSVAWAEQSIARSWGRWHDADFEHLTVERGLPHPTTTALAQNTRGLVWIGTVGGLARYDGYRTQVFRQDDDSPDSLPDNYVRNLLPLADGGLLIGTNSGGLARFDPTTNRFLRYDSSSATGTGARIFGMAADHDGGFWIASQDGLSHLHADLATLEQAPPELNAQLKADAKTFSVLEDSRGNVWLGTNSGLFVRRAGQAAFGRFIASSDTGAATLANDIWAIDEDRTGRIWFGSGSQGVVYLDAKGEVHAPEALSAESEQIQRRTVRAIVELPDGRIWVATDGAGIASYNPDTGEVVDIRHNRAEPASIGGNIVRALMVDRTGGIWAATESGASRHDTRAPSVYTLDGSVILPGSSMDADENVRSLFTDTAGTVWLGFNQGRVVGVDPATGRIRNTTLGGGQAGQDVKAIAGLPDGRLVLGARGLVTMDPATLKATPYHVPDLDTRPILSLCPCQGGLLVGTYDGLYRLREGHPAQLFRHDAKDPNSLADNQVRNLVPMADGSVWAATTNGISILRRDASAFENVQNMAADDASLPQDYVGSIVTANHRVWIGTYGGIGVAQLIENQAPHGFSAITQKDGLGSDNVSSLLADRRGRIWAATANGLTVYDPATKQAQALGLRDGYRTRFFNHRTAGLGPAGELLFGGIGGLTVVDADADSRHQSGGVQAPLAITSLIVNERERPFATLPRDGSALALDADTRTMRAGFALLDFAATGDMRYSYRLEGFDDGWIPVEPGVPPTAVYTNLPGGHYTLHLRVAITGLHSQVIESTVPINVEPRGFERWRWRIAAIVAMGLLFWLALRVRTRFLRGRARHLAALVETRTADLRAANDRLDHLANVDELTGLANRRAIMRTLEDACARSHQDGSPVSLLMLDLDRFKALNDRYGHQAGDEVLRRVADAVAATCRDGDQVGRYGGEEIMVVLAQTDGVAAESMAERCRLVVEQLDIPYGERHLRLTTSGGVATLAEGETAAALISRADEAMYRAKRAGRNRVIVG
jgi:diguanylate cyclase (GGDEF)-like protein